MVKKVDLEVGKRIKLRRTMMGMSQGDLAKAMGLTFQQIQKYEKGINALNSGRLHDLGALLNVPISYFFEELEAVDYEPNRKASNSMPDDSFSSDRESLEIMKSFKKIHRLPIRKRLTELIRELTDPLEQD